MKLRSLVSLQIKGSGATMSLLMTAQMMEVAMATMRKEKKRKKTKQKERENRDLVMRAATSTTVVTK